MCRSAERVALMARASSAAPPPREVLSGQACILGLDTGDGFHHVQWWANGHLVRWAVDDGTAAPDLWVQRPWDLDVALLCGTATPHQLAAGSAYGLRRGRPTTTYPALLLPGEPGPEAAGPAMLTVFWLVDHPLGPLPIWMATRPDGSSATGVGAVDQPDLVVEATTADLVRLLLGRLELPDLGARATLSGDVLLAAAVLPALCDPARADRAATYLAVARAVEEYLCALPLLDHAGWVALLRG